MKITSSILSIPPYISTSWKNISSLQAIEEETSFRLIVSLQNKTKVEIPHLTKDEIKKIFDTHAHYIETEETSIANPNPLNSPFSFSLPIPSDTSLIESLGSSSMTHKEEQANLPPLAPDILNKISMVAKAFGFDDLSTLSPPKPDCNCLYCQVARAMLNQKGELEEEISDEDLKFQTWKIQQTGDQLYIVEHPLDSNEHYTVYLGNPLGCTCGKKNCEHIREVLKS